jgi:LDH2 family malate/lactate/ureidoglycolate dehydrogenase
MPGEIELAMKRQRMLEGIFVEDETWQQIVESAAAVAAEVTPE